MPLKQFGGTTGLGADTPRRLLETACTSLLQALASTLQTDPAPSVAQVLAGQAYTNGTLVVPAAVGTIPLPDGYIEAYTDGTDTVTNVDMASAYNVYLVGQDNYTTPNTMVNVSPLAATCIPS